MHFGKIFLGLSRFICVIGMNIINLYYIVMPESILNQIILIINNTEN